MLVKKSSAFPGLLQPNRLHTANKFHQDLLTGLKVPAVRAVMLHCFYCPLYLLVSAPCVLYAVLVHNCVLIISSRITSHQPEQDAVRCCYPDLEESLEICKTPLLDMSSCLHLWAVLGVDLLFPISDSGGLLVVLD